MTGERLPARVRAGVGVPNIGAFADPRLLVAIAVEAEAAGWDGAFLWDHILYRPPHRPAVDPWVVLGAIAPATERVRIGALVTPVARRRPWKLARETATLDVLSGGRVVFGAGLGAPAEDEFARFGEDPTDRVRAQRLDEGLRVLAGLWAGEPFSFAGRHHRVDDARFVPRPVQRPRIPVWIAGRWPGDAPFRRAARWDGVFPIAAGDATLTPDALADCVAFTLRHRTQEAPLEVVTEGVTAAADRARVREYADAGLTWWIERPSSPDGPVEDFRRRVRAGPPR